jgi:Helix-turn-helix domain
MIPTIYPLAEAAELLGVSESWLRARLRDRTFAGMKRAGRWAMTEAQIEAAIERMSTEAARLRNPPPRGCPSSPDSGGGYQDEPYMPRRSGRLPGTNA